MSGPVTDQADVRVMIPRVRRALLGPLGSGYVQSQLNDSDTTAIIADALADVILYGGGTVFGKTLEVTERDNFYQSPVAWKTSEALTEPEQTVIVCQAALNYLMRTLTEAKTAQRIKRADEEWEYSLSASAVAERLKELRAARDSALASMEASEGAMEVWVNTLLVRDQYTDTLIEPYIAGGLGGQTEIAVPDFRFGTVEWIQA